MVMVFDAHAAVTPAGKPVAVPMPEAPVLELVILVNGVLIHSVGLEENVPDVLEVYDAVASFPPDQLAFI